MGKFFIPPLKFILFFLISAAAFIFLTMLYNWELLFSITIEEKNNLLLFLPDAASAAVFPAAASGLLFSIFDRRKERFSPFAAALTAAAVFFVLFSGFSFTSSMISNSGKTVYQPFNEKTIHVTDHSLIYTEQVDEKSVKGLVVRSRGSEGSGFRYYHNAELVQNDHPALKLDEERTIDIVPANPIFNRTLRQEGLLGSYLEDIGYLNSTIKTAAAEGGTEFLILAAAFTAFLMTSMLFRGATSWPLFDFILILVFHRLVFYLFGLFSRETVFISETFFGGRKDINIPLFTIAGLTAILFLAGVLIKTNSGRKT